jgi:hypothetical protein
MPTNNLSPKSKNKLGYASSIPPNMAERFGAAVSPYLQGVQELFPPTNPYGQVVSNFLLGQAPQAAQQMAAGYPNVLFNTSNPLGGNRIVNPVALDMAAALPVATAVKGAGLLAKGAPLVGGITVYHGSPHRFSPTELNDLGEFNAAKIGTGEGAQAYGMGHYTAEARGTGEGYRDQLAKTQVEPGDYAEYFAPNSVRPTYGGHDKILDFDPESGIVTAQSVVKNKNDEWVPEPNSQVRRHKTMPNVAELEKTLGRKPGYLYKVDLPDEHIARMLDWDKPLSEQTAEVQEILKRSGQVIDKNKTGADLVRGRPGTPSDEITSDLAAQGIPGVRYLDAGSRGNNASTFFDPVGKNWNVVHNAPSGAVTTSAFKSEMEAKAFHDSLGNTSNFVVFPGNENMMTILERNGQAASPESQAIARYREVKGPKSVVRMEAALRTAGVPLPKNEPVAYIQRLVDQAHRRN